MATVSKHPSTQSMAGVEASDTPRSSEPAIFRILLGGLVATLAIVLMICIVDPILMGREVDASRLLSSRLSGPRGAGRLALDLFNGAVLFPLGFAFLAVRWPGPSVVKGLIWGVIVWILAQGVAMPIMGADFFGSPAGSGMMAMMISLANHLVYGGLLGLIAGISPGTAPNCDRATPDQTGVRLSTGTQLK